MDLAMSVARARRRSRRAPAPLDRRAHDRAAVARRRWKLTARQTEVLELTVLGLSNKEIAERLGCSPRTIELHLTAIYEKSGADRRATLIVAFWAAT